MDSYYLGFRSLDLQSFSLIKTFSIKNPFDLLIYNPKSLSMSMETTLAEEEKMISSRSGRVSEVTIYGRNEEMEEYRSLSLSLRRTSIGVAFNVIFVDWMVTVLLVFLFIGGTKDYKVLMDRFHDLSIAFLELGIGSNLVKPSSEMDSSDAHLAQTSIMHLLSALIKFILPIFKLSLKLTMSSVAVKRRFTTDLEEDVMVVETIDVVTEAVEKVAEGWRRTLFV
ncbi:hypothetical protein Syun_024010 [Stephania yunnanensis]|uniref:Uncharacterized protein n=1 Tax=Stephania yunnanensis TaxID=152371 RepID=A0AAP0I3X7_9MAGN